VIGHRSMKLVDQFREKDVAAAVAVVDGMN
jgi:hypothetical protein